MAVSFIDSHLEAKALAYSQKYNTTVEKGRMAVRLMLIAEASLRGMTREIEFERLHAFAMSDESATLQVVASLEYSAPERETADYPGFPGGWACIELHVYDAGDGVPINQVNFTAREWRDLESEAERRIEGQVEMYINSLKPLAD